MNPKISVVVIGYNIQEYIEKCLESILFQSFNDYQVIFVNDGSKDDTLNIALKYKEQIRIVDKPNGGIVSARKAGLKVAEGDYITFVDGDDWLNVDFLENLYSPIYSNKDIDIVCSSYFFQDQGGSFSKASCCGNAMVSCKEYEFFNGIIEEKIDHHMFPKLYKKEFVLKAGYIDYPEVTMAEDWITNAFFGLFKPNVFFSDTTNYFYRFNGRSVSRKGDNKILEQIKTLNYMEAFFKEKCDFDYKEKMDYLWFAYVREYLLGNTEPNVKKEILKAYKNKNIDNKNNTLFQESINQLGKIAKLKLVFEMKMPILIPMIDYLYDEFKSIIKKYKYKENAKIEESLELLYDSYIKKLGNSRGKKNIFLIGTSDRSNIGDHAIALSEVNFLKETFPEHSVLEITGDTFRKRREVVKDIIKADDIIFITGGGFLGDLWPDEEYMVNAILEDYPDNKVIVFPQTIYFYDDSDSPLLSEKLKNYLNHKSLFLTARDKKTYEFYSRYFDKHKIGLFPDMALYLNGIENSENFNNVMMCLRSDKERIITKNEEFYIINTLESEGLEISYGSTLASGAHNGDIKLSEREKAIRDKLEEFAKPRIIITDRLHGMVLATLAGTPCIVFDNISKKVSGVYNLWLKNIDTIMFCDGTDNINEKITEALRKEHFKYSPKYLDDERKRFIAFIKKIMRD